MEVKKEDDSPAEEESNTEPRIVYEMISEDGFRAESSDLASLWVKVFEAVQDARLQHGLELCPVNPLDRTGQQMIGLAHSALAYLVEQLPGAKNTEKYNFKHHKIREEGKDEGPLPINESGSARSETYKGRKPLDMFSWLASRYRSIPKMQTGNGGSGVPEVKLQLSANRRATQLELPMAMRFRHLAKSAKEAVDVFQSAIHGRGLYCKREIQVFKLLLFIFNHLLIYVSCCNLRS
jgi:histone-lysine N-methyltransferase MLL4